MNPLLVKLLGVLLEEAVSAGPQLWNDVAHGEGGAQKVSKVAGDLATVAAHVAAGAAS